MRRNSVPEWPFLAVYLINEASLNRSSKWNAYISALPRHPYSILQWYCILSGITCLCNMESLLIYFFGFQKIIVISFLCQLPYFPRRVWCFAFSFSNFRSRAEVEMYLAASPVKMQAIECINDVNETYGHDFSSLKFSLVLFGSLYLCHIAHWIWHFVVQNSHD